MNIKIVYYYIMIIVILLYIILLYLKTYDGLSHISGTFKIQFNLSLSHSIINGI